MSRLTQRNSENEGEIQKKEIRALALQAAATTLTQRLANSMIDSAADTVLATARKFETYIEGGRIPSDDV